MEDTLDSIHPSEDQQEEMSYLFGRDPSILAYNQRPFPSKDTKKNLLSLYEMDEITSFNESASTNSDSQNLQTVKVYLRLKPFPKKLKLMKEQQEAYKIINSTTLVTRLPILDNNISCIKQYKSSNTVCRKFTFSQTFGPETTQLELFEQTVQQQMIDFLTGHNCTIMTYGTTNSGKSYTLQGTTTSPGLIPRALEFLFSNITTKPNPSYKPLHNCNVVSLNALDRAQELEAKTKLLTFTSVDKHQYMNTYKEMQKLLQEESVRPSQCHDAHYSIWVSFAEIYNEIIYDLLSNECQKKRIPLKLGTDSHGRAFIKGLKTIYVNSAAEAYQVLMAGQYNLKVAATALNAKSSRSHCIFTITLLKYYAENLPNTVEVSIFSFCDLAGSERLKKTLNIGDRLKEAQNINTSLLVLGRCLKSIHEGQLTRMDTIGPFRESKLTRLFQQALSGKEYLALIVNVNPLPNLYVETQNVLNFAAIAKKIVIEKKKKVQKKLKSRFSRIVTQSIETVTDWDTTELESIDWQHVNTVESASEYVTSEEYKDLVSENEKLKKEITLLKNTAVMRDFQSRQEMAEKYIAMIKELEIDWKQRITDVETQHEDALEWTVKQIEEFYEGKLNRLHKKKRKHTYCSDDNEEDDNHLKPTLKELDEENVQLRTKNESLKKALTELKVTNETLTIEKNKGSFELGLLKEDLKIAKNLLEAAQKDICLNQDGKVYTKEMTAQFFAKEQQIKKLKEILNEAKEEYIAITSDLKQKEHCIDEQRNIIIENEERIKDLESHIEELNVCLTEKTRIIEFLEEKLEQQLEKLSDNGNEILQLQEENNKLSDKKLTLLKSYQKPIVPSSSVAEHSQYDTEQTNKSVLSETCIQNEYQEIIIKEELITHEIPEDLSSITENAQEKIKNTINNSDLKNLSQPKAIHEADIVTDLNDLGLVRQVISTESLKETPQSLQILQSNIAEPDINCTKKEYIKSFRVLVERSCQVDINNDKNCHDIKDSMKKKTCCKSIQTVTTIITAKDTQTDCSKASLKEEATQTDQIVENSMRKQLEKLTTRYNDTQIQYEQECLKVKELAEELCNMKMTLQSLREENNSNTTIMDQYKNSAELLQEQLMSVTEEKRKIQEVLSSSNMAYDKKITNYEQTIDQLEKNLLTTKNNAEQYLEKLGQTQKELDNYTLNYKKEKEVNVYISDEFVQIKKENNVSNVSVEQLNEHVEKIVQIEESLKTMAELKDNIIQLNKSLETCQMEKNSIQEALDGSNKKLLELEKRFEQITLKEEEKDAEIATLQREVKHVIQRGETTENIDDMMDAEFKSIINELTQTKEILSQKEQYIKELKIHLDNFERNTKIFNLLEENAKERQVENERLQNINDELITNLAQREREMNTFMKNRDETVAKYEMLVKNQQEELDRQKREVMRYQELFRRQVTSTPNKNDYKILQNRIEVLQDRLQKYEGSAKSKDYCDNTSEDEILAQRQSKRRGRKTVLSAKQENIPVVELSESESKRSTRRTALPTPSSKTSTEKKRTTRKKKLFLANDSFADIEPSENSVIPATPLPTRSLRNRKK